MSARMTDKDGVLPALLGRPLTDVAVDEALVRPDRWSEVDLAALSAVRHDRKAVVDARLGVGLDQAGDTPCASTEDASTSQRQTPVAAEKRTFVENVGPRRLARVTRLAAVADLADLPPEGPARSAPAPMRVTPIPAPRGVVWQARPALDSGAILSNRKNFRSLIFLMIALWSAILTVGIYKAVTPPSGYDLRWRD